MKTKVELTLFIKTTPSKETELTNTALTTTGFLPIISPSLTKKIEPMKKPAKSNAPNKVIVVLESQIKSY